MNGNGNRTNNHRPIPTPLRVRWMRFQTNAIAAATQEERTRFAQHEAAIARLTREKAKLDHVTRPDEQRVARTYLHHQTTVITTANRQQQ